MTSDEWSKVQLGAICEVITKGTTPRHKVFPDTASVKFIKVRDIGASGELYPEELERIDRATHEGPLARSVLRENDVLFTIAGTIGRTAIVHRDTLPANTNQAVAILRPKPGELDSRFLSYLLRSGRFQRHALSRVVQSVQKNVSLGILRESEVLIPPLAEQHRIAGILGSLDDKIELNQKMNRTLEEVAQAIFKSWFIDFDGVPPEDLVDSEAGPVPTGWTAEALDEVAHFLNGTACQKYPAVPGEPSLPVIKIRELNQGITEQSDRATAAIPDKWLVADGDVLFSWSGSLVVKVWTGGPGALNQHLFKVTSEDYPRWLFLLWTQHHLREFQRIAADKATTMGHIKRQHLADAKCVIPPPEVLNRAGDLLAPVIERHVLNDIESRTLRDIRDTLLPKLISGEVRVPEAEQALEATA